MQQPTLKILLTGATGLIGKEVGNALTQAGHQVYAVTRSKQHAEFALPFRCEIIEWDAQSAESLTSQTIFTQTQFDGVIHLMGENVADGRWSPQRKLKLKASRVQATRFLVQAFQNKSPAFWIQGSAIGIYGKGFLANLCQEWEREVEALPHSTRVVILRTGVVMSHKGGAYPKLTTPLLQGFGGVLGDGHQRMAMIHLDDVARFIVFAIHSTQVKGAYPLACHEPIPQRQLIEKLALKLHCGTGLSIPAVALKLLLGEMSTILLEGPAIESQDLTLTQTGFDFHYPNADAILNEVTSWNMDPVTPYQSAFVKYDEQFLPKPLDEVYAFFSEATNLEKITPDFLHFKIKEISTQAIEQNTFIRYQLKLHGFPLTWLTRIDIWEPPHRFVDHQLKGPYALWYHEHRFEAVAGGTLMKDWVRFRLPLGKLGQWFGFLKIKADIERIFEFRRSQMKTF